MCPKLKKVYLHLVWLVERLERGFLFFETSLNRGALLLLRGGLQFFTLPSLSAITSREADPITPFPFSFRDEKFFQIVVGGASTYKMAKIAAWPPTSRFKTGHIFLIQRKGSPLSLLQVLLPRVWTHAFLKQTRPSPDHIWPKRALLTVTWHHIFLEPGK